MDEGRFDQFFAPGVTKFFPGGPFPNERVEGRDAVLSVFHDLFKRVKERGRTTLNVVPLNLRVQQYGDIAVVTFQLDQEGAVGRRSVVFRNFDGEWLIVHFHAPTIDP